MCSSKEAWQHFLFVPSGPPRRLRRRADHGCFLDVSTAQPVATRRTSVRNDGREHAQQFLAQRSVPVNSQDEPHRAAVVRPRGTHGMALARSRRVRDHIEHDEETPRIRSTVREAYGSIAAAVVTTTVSMTLGGGHGAVMAMMPVALPFPGNNATTQSDGGLLSLLFPGFDTSTFIWRISMLQVAEYIGSLLMGHAFGAPKLCSLYLLGASWGPAIASGAVWRLLFPMTLHANAMHIFFNVFFQLRIGFDMEHRYGRRKFCMMYIFCGFMGNLMSVMADPMKLAVGASTSGFGLLGVWAAEILLTWERLGDSKPRVAIWLAFMTLSGIMMSAISPNVDFIGHFGGALAGFLLTIILADMQEDQQPAYYHKAKIAAKQAVALLLILGLVKAIPFGPSGPIPNCGTIFHPKLLPF